MPSTYTLISSNVLASSAASVTFSAIPSTYTDLVLRASTRVSTGAGLFDTIAMRLNGDTATNYSDTYLRGDGSSASSGRDTSFTRTFVRMGEGNGTTANTFGSVEIYIPSYTASQNKPISSVSMAENNATDSHMAINANLWRNTAAITTILLYSENALSFASGSSFYLYGIKNS
jgi:hypothetical protein